MNPIMRGALPVLAILAGWSPAGQDPEKKPEEGPKNPKGVYVVAATVKSALMKGNESYSGFKDRLKKQLPHLELKSIAGVGDFKEGMERWTLLVDAREALDPGKLLRVFQNLKVHRLDIGVNGTAVRAEKFPEQINFVCHHSGWKVRLNSMKKREGDPTQGEDLVGKIAKGVDKGKPHFQVRGELTWTSAGQSIVVESMNEVDPPPKSEPEGLK